MEAYSSDVVNLHYRTIFINNFLNIKTDQKPLSLDYLFLCNEDNKVVFQ